MLQAFFPFSKMVFSLPVKKINFLLTCFQFGHVQSMFLLQIVKISAKHDGTNNASKLKNYCSFDFFVVLGCVVSHLLAIAVKSRVGLQGPLVVRCMLLYNENSVKTCKKGLHYFNPLPDDKILDWSKLKQIAEILTCIEMKNKCHIG